MKLTFREWIVIISALKTYGGRDLLAEQAECKAIEAKLMVEFKRACPDDFDEVAS